MLITFLIGVLGWTGTAVAQPGGLPACRAKLNTCGADLAACSQELASCQHFLPPGKRRVGTAAGVDPLRGDGAGWDIRAGAALAYMDNATAR